ncbi:hypothetical protein IEQ34_020519 [Dendrobium chrysotoxum]|uniref:Uncharacterized protein n=1 Tax=Dendrobium chrysotoxum TaxID=161865 RepID=A0AAV7G2A6_DENCH|nr:hypothetical protein IEQ34_020519 [Dendrobium chrysotoxum]
MMINQLLKDQKVSGEKIVFLKADNKRLQNLITGKETALSRVESRSRSLRVINDFKKSIAFKTIIKDHIQEACNHIYNAEVKALE